MLRASTFFFVFCFEIKSWEIDFHVHATTPEGYSMN